MTLDLTTIRALCEAATPDGLYVACRTIVPQMLAEIERLRAEVSLLRTRASSNQAPCSCTAEVGDSACEQHPTCNWCGDNTTALSNSPCETCRRQYGIDPIDTASSQDHPNG